MNITVVGAGYVGLSMAVLLAQNHPVVLLDIDKDRVNLINQGLPPFNDSLLEEHMPRVSSNLIATIEHKKAYQDASLIIIAVPTHFCTKRLGFDTGAVESALKDIEKNNAGAQIVIKSTVPIGFSRSLQENHPDMNILFSPEFIREGKALWDNFYPSRIVVGGERAKALLFAKLLEENARKHDVEILLTSFDEAESIKLFSNAYLAMRVAFINELDSFAATYSLDSQIIIKGIGLDPRIGNHYNNPSFGYGGYCLPKDSQQLLANYQWVPNRLIEAIVEANSTRKDFIVSDILNRKPNKIGVYRLTMKKDSDNFRESSIVCIIKRLKENGANIVIYEPLLNESEYLGIQVVNDLSVFKAKCDLIVTNRLDGELSDIVHKVYSRDIFQID